MGQDNGMASQGKPPPPSPAKATLTCLKLSHPFQNRTLVLEGRNPVKIGRSGLHVLSAPNNALFDCVVISRDHARLWFDSGKFYMQDSKSSNGTFVNNELIGEKNKESLPTAVYSGDVVQFGSAVFSPDMKSRLGAIIALLRLYLPDGTEYPARPPGQASPGIPTVQLQLLASYLRDAEHREETLRKKLSVLEHLVGCTSKAASEGWRAQVLEDQLLTKIASLQKQVEVLSSKSLPEECLRGEMATMTESNCQASEVSKKYLEEALKERNEAMQKSDDISRSQENLLNECAYYKSIAQQSQEDLKDLGQKYSLYFEKYLTLSQTVEIDKELHDKCKMLEQENRRLAEYAEKIVKEKELIEKCLKSLQEDKTVSQGTQSAVVISTTKKDVLESDIVPKPKFSVTLVSPVEEATSEGDKTPTSITSADGQIREVNTQVEQMLQRFERIEQVENIKVEKLKNINQRLENLNSQCRSNDQSNLQPIFKECLDEIGSELSTFFAESNKSNKEEGTSVDGTKHFNDIINNLKADNTRLTSQLIEMVEKFKYLEAKKDLYQTDLKILTLKSVENVHEIASLRRKLLEAQTGITSRNNTILELQKKTLSLEKSSEEDVQVINKLREKLGEEQVKRDELARECESQMGELQDIRETLKNNQSEYDRLKVSLLQLKEGSDPPLESGVAKVTVSGGELTETLFEQKCVIEQMQANLAGVERERAMFGDLVKELAETKQACALKYDENAELLKKIQRLEANVDPVVGYFIPVVVALMFLFAVVMFTNRRPVASVNENVTLPG